MELEVEIPLPIPWIFSFDAGGPRFLSQKTVGGRFWHMRMLCYFAFSFGIQVYSWR